jgi:hypothetical protein
VFEKMAFAAARAAAQARVQKKKRNKLVQRTKSMTDHALDR